MKLNDFNPAATASRALKEHYNLPMKLNKMSMFETRTMLRKVRGLMTEAKQSPSFYRSQTSPSYLKLVFMEQALAKHFSKMRPGRIMFENEEVQKSQVVLAAQDMVDSVQKMLEQVSDLMVKELPALVDSVQSEIGVDESQEFSQQVSDALGGLTSALTQAKTTLQGALNTITGQGGDAAAFDGEGELGGDDMGMGDEMPDMGGDDMGGDEMPDMGEEEPESAPVGNLGRGKR
jgi:hypothetical protein